jgi:hypothetical protein
MARSNNEVGSTVVREISINNIFGHLGASVSDPACCGAPAFSTACSCGIVFRAMPEAGDPTAGTLGSRSISELGFDTSADPGRNENKTFIFVCARQI